MRLWWLALAGLLLIPSASACVDSVPPMLDIQFDDEPEGLCHFSEAGLELEGCMMLPMEPLLLQGTVAWSWNDLPCTAEAAPPIEDVLIEVSSIRLAWFRASDPPLLRITPADQLDPAPYIFDGSGDPRNVVEHRVTKPFSISLTAAREPTTEELAILADNGGLLYLLFRATSSESYGWTETFATEQVGFDARSLLAEDQAHPARADGQVVPVPGLVLAAAALLAVALLRRR